MKLFGALRAALMGWRAILLGHAGWARHFALTTPGYVTALAIYFCFAFLVLLTGAAPAALNPISIVIGLSVFGLYALALALGAFATRLLLRWDGPLLAILVPGTYGLIAYLVLGALLSLLAPPLIVLALAAMGILLFRLGRVAGRWNRGISIAFAAIVVVLLVALPLSLYMLASPDFPNA